MQLLKLNDNVKKCASLDYMVRKIWKMAFNLNSDSLQPMDWSMAGFPVLHYLPEFGQTPVNWVSDAI